MASTTIDQAQEAYEEAAETFARMIFWASSTPRQLDAAHGRVQQAKAALGAARDEHMAELRAAIAAGLAGILVTRQDQLCSGGREPIACGARAYEDADGWVFCPVHIPEPAPGRNGERIEYDRDALTA